MFKNCVGIDVSYKTFDVVVRKQSKALRSVSFENNAKGHKKLISYLKKHHVSHVGLEATSYYHLDIAVLLHETVGIQVMVINPRSAKSFARTLLRDYKTDQADAALLAEYVERLDFRPWQAPSANVLELRACSRRLVFLSKECTRAKNQLHAFSQTQATPKVVLDDVRLSIQQLEAQMERLVSHGLALIQSDSQLAEQHRLITSIKGVADKTAIKLLGELGVLAQDMNAKQWVAHAALNPRPYQSGTSIDKRLGIGKSGNKYIREALYMSALSAKAHDPHIGAFYTHLVDDNGLTKLQAVCAVMRKLLVAIHGMIKQNKLFESERFYTIAD